ncbi:MAG: RNA methyltransferase [Prolixibacteraceae bacterium]|nr:RNA methyltransferase [Prolixibacteraceae bacterium]
MIDQGLIDYLSAFITHNRLKQFQKIIKNRTRYITVVLEDIYQSQNASAVLRSCECFGIQDVHIIENKNEFTVNTDVSLGASKWIDLYKYNKKDYNTPEAFNALREKGYKIIATSPHINDTLLDDFNLDRGKTALVFGTEITGITGYVEENADGFLKIPIVGFTESFNISVSAAIILHHLSAKLRKANLNWQLNAEEQKELLYNWLTKSIKKSDLIVKEYQSRDKNKKIKKLK